MKKSVYVLALLFAFCSCSREVDVFEEYFEEWDISIFYQDVSKTETYKLLETLNDFIREHVFYPVPDLDNQHPFHTPTSTTFNNFLRNNKEAAALFERNDCVYVLMSTYLDALQDVISLRNSESRSMSFMYMVKGWPEFMQEIMSSDLFMSKMNVAEKVQLMVLALESAKIQGSCPTCPFNIMISIMLSSDYTPFVKEVKPILIELSPCCYGLKSDDYKVILVDVSSQYYNFKTEGYISIPGVGVDKQANDLITEYARQFIINNKK